VVTILTIAMIINHHINQKKTETMLSKSSQHYIDKIITSEMDSGHIPGLSVLIMKDNKVYLNKGYGYANTSTKVKATPKTRYEIASNTKAFTGYAILQLENEGKLHLSDKVSKYVPGFYMKYKDKRIDDITINQLIAQTSGIPGDITDNDTITSKNDSLSGIVDSIKGRELNNKPGDQFEYSNMNYDILGLIVQKVSGQSYSSYLENQIFSPLNMHQTYVKGDTEKKGSTAQGYEIKHGKAVKDNPKYNVGDGPAAYMVSSTKDLESWMSRQLNPTQATQSLVQSSHKPKVKTADDNKAPSYATGWFVDDSEANTIVYHPGTLENFSSYILLNKKKNYGIVVLANAYSDKTPDIAEDLNSQILNNKNYTTIENAINQSSLVSYVIITLSLFITIAIAFYMLRRIINIYHGTFVIHVQWKLLGYFLIIMAVFISLMTAIYLLPDLVMGNTNWDFIMVWLPLHAKLALWSVMLTILCATITLVTMLFSKKKR